MAYENVDVSKIRNAMSQCLSVLEKTTEIEIVNDISNDTVWVSFSRDHLKVAFEKIIYTRYPELQKTFDQLATVTNFISDYQDARNKYDENVQKTNNLNDRLYYRETYTETTYDSEGNPVTTTKTRTVKDTTVEAQINQLSEENRNLKITMVDIQSRIDNSVANI